MATIFENQLTSREEWIEACYLKNHSNNAPNMAKISLKHWDAFLNKNYPDSKEFDIIKDLKKVQSEPELAIFLNKFVQYLSSTKLSPKSCRDYFGFIKSWLRANAIRINDGDVRQFVHQPKLIRESKHPITVDEIRRIHDKSSKVMQTLLVTLMSSGMRVSECLQLKLNDIDLENGVVRLRADTTKTREERMSFVSREAVSHIRGITIQNGPNDFIFAERFSRFTLGNIEARFSKARKAAGLDFKYDLTDRYRINIHGLRAFFHTEATKIVGGDIAHAMIGHHGYLDQYLRVSIDERKEMYKKIEPHVSLSQENRLKKKLENAEMQIKSQDYFDRELQKRDDEIRRLNDAISSIRR